MPSNVTCVPATVVASAPLAPTTNGVMVAGPMLVPKIRMFSPGASDVGLVLAAFWIAASAGAITGAGVTVRAMGRMSGELVAPAIETPIVCACGLALPIWKLTGASDAGFTVIVGAFVRVNVTGIVCELEAPGDEMTI